ncbi:hypothetical protein ACH32G_03135 [Bacillus sp. CIS52]
MSNPSAAALIFYLIMIHLNGWQHIALEEALYIIQAASAEFTNNKK